MTLDLLERKWVAFRSAADVDDAAAYPANAVVSEKTVDHQAVVADLIVSLYPAVHQENS